MGVPYGGLDRRCGSLDRRYDGSDIVDLEAQAGDRTAQTQEI